MPFTVTEPRNPASPCTHPGPRDRQFCCPTDPDRGGLQQLIQTQVSRQPKPGTVTGEVTVDLRESLWTQGREAGAPAGKVNAGLDWPRPCALTRRPQGLRCPSLRHLPLVLPTVKALALQKWLSEENLLVALHPGQETILTKHKQVLPRLLAESLPTALKRRNGRRVQPKQASRGSHTHKPWCGFV